MKKGNLLTLAAIATMAGMSSYDNAPINLNNKKIDKFHGDKAYQNRVNKSRKKAKSAKQSRKRNR